MQVGGEWEPAAVILQDPILSELLMARRNVVETVDICESHIKQVYNPIHEALGDDPVAVEPSQVMQPNSVCFAAWVLQLSTKKECD